MSVTNRNISQLRSHVIIWFQFGCPCFSAKKLNYQTFTRYTPNITTINGSNIGCFVNQIIYTVAKSRYAEFCVEMVEISELLLTLRVDRVMPIHYIEIKKRYALL